MITETIDFHFDNAEQQRRFHETLEGSDTKRIAELEEALRNLVADCDSYEFNNNLAGTWATLRRASQVLLNQHAQHRPSSAVTPNIPGAAVRVSQGETDNEP